MPINIGPEILRDTTRSQFGSSMHSKKNEGDIGVKPTTCDDGNHQQDTGGRLRHCLV